MIRRICLPSVKSSTTSRIIQTQQQHGNRRSIVQVSSLSSSSNTIRIPTPALVHQLQVQTVAPSFTTTFKSFNTIQRQQHSYLSSTSMSPSIRQDENVIVIPPNLKFDPRAKSTPIYGLDQIQDKEEKQEEVIEGIDETDLKGVTKKENYDNSTINDQDDLIEEEEYDDVDDDIDEYTSYSLANKPEPTYVIPLPDRLHIPIIDFLSSTSVGTIHLSPYIFGNDPIRIDILHRCVIYQRNKKRGLRNAGAKTKTIHEVSGSGKKMRNQKGGGVARAGHKRPAHWRGGAKAHGPKGNVQNYETKLNKKVRMLGIRMALSQKLKEGNIILVNSFQGLDSYKTKVLAGVLETVGGIGGRNGCTALVIDHVPEEEEEREDGTLRAVAGVDVNLKVASGNLHKVKVRNQKFVNVYDLLKYEKLVLSLDALTALEHRYKEV